MKLARALVWLALEGCRGCSAETAAPPRDAAPDVREAGALDAAAPVTDASAESSFEALPDGGAADLELRGKHLLQAISENDLSLAADIVLPREAYLAARDASDPGAQYESKFKPSMSAQIARIRRHEKGIDRAVFVSLDLGGAPTREEPRKHEWKEPVWRIGRSKLTFTVDGRVRRVEIAEMIAWRGSWYVARLREGR